MVIVRLFELVIALVLVLLSLQFLLPAKIGKARRGLLLGGLSVLGIFLGLLHLLLEGWRWQMIPVYLPSLVYFCLGVYQLIKSYKLYSGSDESTAEDVTDKKLAILSIAGMLIIVVLLFSSLFVSSQFPLFQLPEPAGDFDIGTTTFQLVDSSRAEIFTEDTSDTRKFVVKSWYPAEVPAGQAPVPYIESQDKFGVSIQRSFGFPSLIVSHVHLINTHSYLNATLSQEKAIYPVIIFSHGYGGYDFQNTALMEELASQGYIVFSINHAYESSLAIYPDGDTFYEAEQGEDGNLNNSLDVWANDTLLLMNQLEITDNTNIPAIFWDKMDLTRIGLIGHSFGGSTAEEMALADDRVRAGISMDSPHIGRSRELNMTKPFMLLYGQDYGNPEMNDTVYNRAANTTYGLFIDGAKHYNFADINIWSPFLRSINYIGTIDGYRMLDIINTYVVAFFDEYLNGENSPLLDGPSDDYPEIHFYRKNT